ncbi:MAG: Proline iminopeptidase [Chlamydiae bacterium]|nr:Proline iminopeptidase [Chlamydiota bacterium]
MSKFLFQISSVFLSIASLLGAEYAPTPPFNAGYLEVSDVHKIFYEQYGNPNGEPVIVVHGGPGVGCPSSYSRFFDPSFYNIILFDQRGARQSKPFAQMQQNNTQLLIEDMEALRKHLKVDQWILFGGSWGSTLSLAYGQAHPEYCKGFVLRGIFLGRKEDANHLIYGMKQFYPEVWQEFANFIPEDERSDLVDAYYRRVMDPNPDIHISAARAFMKYDLHCATLTPNNLKLNEALENDILVLGVARAFFHYATHNFFLEENQLLKNMDKIKHLPATIVHGRYDLICEPQCAFALHQAWPNSQLYFTENSGHSVDEKATAEALTSTMDLLKLQLSLINNKRA